MLWQRDGAPSLTPPPLFTFTFTFEPMMETLLDRQATAHIVNSNTVMGNKFRIGELYLRWLLLVWLLGKINE